GAAPPEVAAGPRPDPADPGPEPIEAPAAPPTPRSPVSPPAREEQTTTAHGLPKRRRVTATGNGTGEQPLPSGGASAPSTRPARETAAGMGAWQRGTRAGRSIVSPDSEGNVAE